MNDYRWILTNEDTQDRVTLDKDPFGWKELVVTFERDEKWHGVFYGFSTELGFHCDGGGREFVEDAYNSKGSEARIKVNVSYYCNGQYDKIFTGKLNFTSYRIATESGLDGVYLNCEKDDILSILRTREDLEIDLTAATIIDGDAVNSYNYLNYDINLHSKVIHLESVFEYDNHSCCQQFATNGLKELYIVPNIAVINGDFEQTTAVEARCVHDATFNGYLENAPAVINTTDSKVFIETNTVTITWNVSGVMTFNSYDVSAIDACADNCGSGASASKLFDSIAPRLRLFFGNDKNTTAAQACATPISQDDNIQYIDLVTVANFVNPGNGVPKAFSGSGSTQIVLNPGDKVWTYWVIDLNYLSASGDLNIQFEYVNDDLSVTSDTVSTATTGKGIAIFEAWSRLCENITGQTDYAFTSEYYGRTNSEPINYGSNGCGAFTALTNGLNIRRIEKSIFTSLSDLFKACDAIDGIGLGIETYLGNDVVRVEPLDYFYQSTQILDLSDANMIEMRFAEEYVYNEVQTGFAKWASEVVNGLDDPLANATYAIPKIKSIKNVLEKISPFIASMYCIETTRRFNEVSKDWRYDDDNFFIALRREVAELDEAEKDENFAGITGLNDSSSAYNLRFMLTNNISRWAKVFTSGLVKLGTSTIKLLSYEGNKDVSYRVLDTCPGNHDNLQRSSMQDITYPDASEDDSPLWLPEEYTFEYPLTFQQFNVLRTNPYGLIKFGTNKFGWVKSLEYQLTRGMATFTLIRQYGN